MKLSYTALLMLSVTAILIFSACAASPATETHPTLPPTKLVVTEISSEEPVSGTKEETPVETQLPATETPQHICNGILTKELPISPVPSTAITQDFLGEGAYVDILATLNEPGWYYVRMLTSVGWVQQPWVRLTDENCEPTIIEVTQATGLQGKTILSDTFRNPQGWYLAGSPNTKPERIPDSTKNFSMQADGYFARTALTTKALENLTAFEFATSFFRQNAGDQGYVGIRYGDDTSFIEVHILGGDCSINVRTGTGFDENQKTPLGVNRCRDDINDYLHITWDGKGTLQAGINSTEMYAFELGSSYPTQGNLEVIVEAARVQFDFIAVAAP